MDRLTTTRVAERAGVSVGTLYQYYPNKHSLLAAVLKQHLSKIADAMEAACESANGRSLKEMADVLVDAYFHSKWAERDASIALYAISGDMGADAVIKKVVQRVQLAISNMLATCSSRQFEDLKSTSFVLTTCLQGPVQVLLVERASRAVVERTRIQMRLLAAAYLERAASPADVSNRLARTRRTISRGL